MEEFTEEFDALEARRKAALEKLRAATVAADQDEIRRWEYELSQIEAAIAALGEEDA
ncbi:MAG: hypothetical protein JO234_01830 [Hyphomicrobiales bacterium]|nr:hypothetical protein [Hyphomicrobiales bacterium]